jgi:hypothetical protein
MAIDKCKQRQETLMKDEIPDRKLQSSLWSPWTERNSKKEVQVSWERKRSDAENRKRETLLQKSFVENDSTSRCSISKLLMIMTALCGL